MLQHFTEHQHLKISMHSICFTEIDTKHAWRKNGVIPSTVQ